MEPILIFLVATLAIIGLGIAFTLDGITGEIKTFRKTMPELFATMGNRISAVGTTLYGVDGNLSGIRSHLRGLEVLANHAIEKTWPSDPEPPTTEEKLERVAQVVQELARRADAASATAATVGHGDDDDLQKIASAISELAGSTQANGQALTWLIEFVKRANPKAAA